MCLPLTDMRCHPESGAYPEGLDRLHRVLERAFRLAQHVGVPAALDNVPVRLRARDAALAYACILCLCGMIWRAVTAAMLCNSCMNN